MWQFVFNRALLMLAQATTPAGEGSSPITIVPQQATTSTYHHTVWHTLLLIIYFLVCAGLVVTVLLQTSKSEGLSGAIGGGTQSVFKGKKDFEERLQEITNYLAVSFVVISFLVSIFAFRVK